MRKIFTSLKSVVSAVVIAAMAFSVSCSYDDTAINQRVDKVEKDLAALTERVGALESKLQTEVDALKALIDGKVVIVDVIAGEDGTTVIKLSDGKTITVVNECKYVACDHECTPCDCDNLKYRVVDGVLEVSADGETWIPVNPEENPCDCDNLLYRVIDGVLEVSADGETWVAINGVAADQVVVDVVLNEDGTATIKLATGEQFTTIKAELIECEAARTGVYVLAGGSREVAFSVNDAVVDINIMNQPFGWSATVEEAAEAPEAGDGGAIAPMPLAAGGKNYVLTINGPAASLKEAAKEGVVSVHFNTAAGACKVLSIDVNLAELTLSVDMAGNITLTNTLAESAGVDEMGNPMFDFVDFHIGIVDAADYATYGDHVFAETFDDLEYEYTANVASTQRTTGFQNIVDLMFYEDGVCEKESYTLTVDQLAGAFWPKYTFELGKEYIIFATTETEMVSYVEHPILTNAVKDSYRRVSVEAKIVEDSVTWNNATAEFNLAGYNLFTVGWIPVAMLDEFVLNGLAENRNSALAFYLAADRGYMNGALLPETKGTYKLAELAAISMTEWAPEILSDTEYLFFVYPFNAQTEMEMYTHQFVKENLVNCGTFRTAALKLGNFDAGAKIEATVEEDAVGFTATFSKDVVTVAWVVSEDSYLDSEEAASAILDNFYTEFVTFDDEIENPSVDGYKSYWNGRPEPLYLAMLAINAGGEYVYVEYEFKEEGEPETPVEPETPALTIDKVNWTSVKATGGTDGYTPLCLEFESAEGYSMTLSGYIVFDDPEQPYLNDSWWMNYSYNGSFNAGLSYVIYPDESKKYFTESGWINISESEGKYWIYFSGVKLSGEEATYSFSISCDIEGLILPSEYELPEGVFVPVRAEVEGLGDGDSNWKGWFYDASENCLAVEGFWDLDLCIKNARGQYIPVGGQPVDITVTKTQDPIANGTGYYYFNFAATWDGGSVDMQALSLPVVEKDAAPVELPNCENLILQLCTVEGYKSICFGAYADVKLVDANGKNYINIQVNDGSLYTHTYTYSDAETESAGTLYSPCCYVRYDGPGVDDSDNSVAPGWKSGTVEVVVDGSNCTITVDLVLVDGNKYSGVYSGPLPF